MNPYKEEIIHAHAAIENWLSKGMGSLEVLIPRFAADFTMITPGGVCLDYPALGAIYTKRQPQPEKPVPACGPDSAALSGLTRLHQAFQPIDPFQRLAWRQGVRIEILQRFNSGRCLLRGGKQ